MTHAADEGTLAGPLELPPVPWTVGASGCGDGVLPAVPPLELRGVRWPERRVAALAVIEHDEPVEHRGTGLGMCPPVGPVGGRSDG